MSVRSDKAPFNWQDPFLMEEQLSEEERLVRDTARQYAQEKLLPRVREAYNKEETDPEIFREMGELGLLGSTIEGYGCAGVNYVCYGLAAREVEAVDSGYRSMMSVQSSLVMHPINVFGSEEQKQKYVTKLATGEWIGCYCLTEPDAGSDANSGKTSAKLSDDGKHYIINGQKMWISNAGYADVLIVFAKIDDDKNLTAFILEKDYEGITMNEEEEKLGIKGSSTRQIFFNDVKVPVENLLGELKSQDVSKPEPDKLNILLFHHF